MFKPTIKRIISCVLVCILAFSLCIVAVNAVGEKNSKLPVIYIKGQGSAIVKDYHDRSNYYKTWDKKYLAFPPYIPDGYITEACNGLAAPLAKALVTNQWEDYGNRLYDAMAPYLAESACDKDGNVPNNSASAWVSSTAASRIQHESTSSDFYVWAFEYDWRLDPVAVSEDFNKYVDFVLAKTGATKVNVLARCLGGNIVLAYLNKYGGEKINDCVMCCIAFDGFESIGAAFAGKFNFNADAIDRFVATYLTTDDYADDPMFSAMRYFVSILNYTPMVNFASDVVGRVFDGIHDDALKRILRDSVASMPSMWSFVGDDYYETAKAYIFGGVEEEYATFIEKIDNFHYNVLVNYNDILDSAEADGLRMYNVCKYGFQMVPITGDSKVMSDTLVSTKRTSLGATCSTLEGKLSSSYIAAADPKYISPDKQIDASTCKYPEHTWFIKNLTHKFMPNKIDDVFAAIINFDGYTTVSDLEDYPQFLMASNDGTEIVPATAKNSSNQDKISASPLEALLLFLMKLITFLLEKF